MGWDLFKKIRENCDEEWCIGRLRALYGKLALYLHIVYIIILTSHFYRTTKLGFSIDIFDETLYSVMRNN